MVEGQEKRSRVRLFVALELPRELRDGIADWGGRELGDPALRPVPAESLHLTLAFLGQRDPAEAEPIAAAMAAAAGSAPQIELCDPEPRPPRGRPRLFALPARSQAAVALQADLSARLVEAELYEPEKRAFWSHVTVARVRSQGRGGRRVMAVARSPGSLPQALSEPFLAVRLALYRSELQSRGARYVPLAQVELPAAGGSEVI